MCGIETTEHTQPDAPWLQREAFPEKPTDSPFGYIAGGKYHGCSPEEILEKYNADQKGEIGFIWCPEAPRVIPVEEAPFLTEAVTRKLLKKLSVDFNVGLTCSLIFGGLTWFTWPVNHGRSLYLLLLLMVGLIPMVQARWALRKLKQSGLAEFRDDDKTNRYGSWIAVQPVWMTWVLLGLLIAVFLVEMSRNLSLSIMAADLNKQAVWEGQWWRLFTAPLMHANFIHIFYNATALIGLGKIVEILGSRYHLALVFFVSAISGSIFSLFLMPHMPSVGASGGLLGLIGFLGVLGWRRKHLLPPRFVKAVLTNILVIGLLGVVAYAMVDNAAHFGGLVGGAFLGLVLVPRKDYKLPLRVGPGVTILGVMSFIALLLCGAFAILKMRQ